MGPRLPSQHQQPSAMKAVPLLTVAGVAEGKRGTQKKGPHSGQAELETPPPSSPSFQHPSKKKKNRWRPSRRRSSAAVGQRLRVLLRLPGHGSGRSGWCRCVAGHISFSFSVAAATHHFQMTQRPRRVQGVDPAAMQCGFQSRTRWNAAAESASSSFKPISKVMFRLNRFS